AVDIGHGRHVYSLMHALLEAKGGPISAARHNHTTMTRLNAIMRDAGKPFGVYATTVHTNEPWSARQSQLYRLESETV
ncbi:MAG: hypothetical protein JO019_04290, partial [Candidatus Kaiserbacteria bacterium]|nr:hypothetical protein [Candidatus Kaiserbacteria bacterium]